MNEIHVVSITESTDEDRLFGWNGLGWYFYDESGAYLHGPYNSISEAKTGFKNYTKQLESK